MKYAALFIGVNTTPDADPLNYAESDAAKMARLSCSNLLTAAPRIQPRSSVRGRPVRA